MKKTNAMVEERIVLYCDLKVTFNDTIKCELKGCSSASHEEKFFGKHKMLDIQIPSSKYNNGMSASDTLEKIAQKSKFSDDASKFTTQDNSCKLSAIKSNISATFKKLSYQNYEEHLALNFGYIFTSFIRKMFSFSNK